MKLRPGPSPPLPLLLLRDGRQVSRLQVPSKLRTSTVTHNFDRGSQKIQKIVGASWLEQAILSQKLFGLKYFWCQKIKDGYYCLFCSFFLMLVFLACRS
jgi:hypothetical protein